MQKTTRLLGELAALILMAGSVCFAQSSGEAVYKTSCQSCHGAAGMADTGPGRVTRTRPITDPDVKKLSATLMFEYTRDGKDKMRPFKGKLTDEEIRESVAYFRTFLK